MTKDDWARVEYALSGTYGRVVLVADGREVVFQRGLVGKNRLGIVSYIDGCFKGEWISPAKEHPETAYLYPKTHRLVKAKERAAMAKHSPRLIKKYFPKYDPNARMIIPSPFWPSVTAIRRHYQKQFKRIELVSVLPEPTA